MPTPSLAPSRSVRIWDAPLRLMHWLSAICFFGAWLTAESDALRPLHITLGLSLAGLMVMRVLWGLVGSPTARFAQFVKGPQAVLEHLQALVRGPIEPHAGHNPAGGWATLALIGLALAVSLSGWFTWQAGEFYEDLHEGLATALLALVGLHVAAVLFTSLRSRRNLVAAMVTGQAELPSKAGIPSNHRALAWGLGASLLAFWFWALQPGSPLQIDSGDSSREESEHGELMPRKDGALARVQHDRDADDSDDDEDD
ncbi:cytochrome b [Inhella inkyongensis]|uniref:Cytochrome b n=1 Tax=Inhella inkyongensis TaxID=392593 RepID=A0A840S6B6_9BURK|nr:cytochrome b/b6 domain-containing protein [Inhella inkyongensis]MBB5205058.1 cytochrome b [Inhella inkyongensis]